MLEMLLLRAKLFIRFLQNKSFLDIRTFQNKKNIFVFLGADYGNLGDVAITYAQKKYLRDVDPDANIIEIPVSQTFAGIKTVKRIIRKDDVITLIGGGNTSDLYDDIEFLRQLVILNFRKYKIIGFPQTFYFTNTMRGRLCRMIARKVYSYATDMILLARDCDTVNILQSHFSGIRYVSLPDIVMSLDERRKKERRGAVLCLRSDKEKSIPNHLKEQLIGKVKEKFGTVCVLDTQVQGVNAGNRYDCLNNVLENFCSHEIVVTDRLHGMILCFITATPALVVDNTTHKVSACYKWIKDCGYIKMLNDIDDIDAFVPKNEFENTRRNIIDKYNSLLCQEFR